MSKKTNHYVDPEKFTPEMDAWLASYKAAKEAGEPLPNPNDYICRSIIKIADGIGKKFNFRRYPYLDEMKLDAIENAIRYLYNYDPAKGTPFTFLTGNIEKVFKTRIGKEHRQTYYKLKSFEMAGGIDGMGEHCPIEQQTIVSGLEAAGITSEYQDWIASYEEKQDKRRERSRVKAKEREAKKREETSLIKFMKKDDESENC